MGEWLLTEFQACWWSECLTLQSVSGFCTSLCFKYINNDFPWLSSWWVAAVPCCISTLLMIPIFDLQYVSGFLTLLGFMSANNSCPPLSSWWVAACWVLNLLTISILDSLVGKWFLCLSGIKFIDNPCSWLSSWWVATVPCCIQVCWRHLSWLLVCEWLSSLAGFHTC